MSGLAQANERYPLLAACLHEARSADFGIAL